MSDVEVYVRQSVCSVCGEVVYYSILKEQIFCGCGKRKQRYNQDFKTALEQLWKPSQIKSATFNQ